MKVKRSISLFPSTADRDKALNTCLTILKENILPKDDEGFYKIDDVCEEIKKRNPSLEYLNRNHIVELFLIDKSKKILISKTDRIKYKQVKYVKPPDILYFGTVEGLKDRMKNNGLKSNTKGYIKLYSNPEDACSFAKRFTKENENVTFLTIDSKRAFEDGYKFSTYQEGIYIVSHMSKDYIIC